MVCKAEVVTVNGSSYTEAGCTMQLAVGFPNDGLEHLDVSLCEEWPGLYAGCTKPPFQTLTFMKFRARLF